jgi:RNA recognition motif-containing protein
MSKKIYVGNLSFNTNEDALRDCFSGFGEIASVKIIVDRDSGRSKGFGFVEMNSEEEANAAIQSLNGKDLDGRPIRVNEAQERPPREQRSRGYNNW